MLCYVSIIQQKYTNITISVYYAFQLGHLICTNDLKKYFVQFICIVCTIIYASTILAI